MIARIRCAEAAPPVPQNAGRFDHGFLPPGLFRQVRDQSKAYGEAGIASINPSPRTE
jgi:hypothetical protein